MTIELEQIISGFDGAAAINLQLIFHEKRRSIEQEMKDVMSRGVVLCEAGNWDAKISSLLDRFLIVCVITITFQSNSRSQRPNR